MRPRCTHSARECSLHAFKVLDWASDVIDGEGRVLGTAAAPSACSAATMSRAALGRRIVAARKARGLSAAKLAGLLGVSSVAVNHWEKGRHGPDPRLMPRLADALGVSADYLEEGAIPGADPPVGERLALVLADVQERVSRRTGIPLDQLEVVIRFSKPAAGGVELDGGSSGRVDANATSRVRVVGSRSGSSSRRPRV